MPKGKKTPSAWTLFSKDKREELKKQFPDEKPAVIKKKVSDAWKEVSEEEKAKYQAQADEIKASKKPGRRGKKAAETAEAPAEKKEEE